MIDVAVAGATGVIGQRFVQRLVSHPAFRLVSVAAGDDRIGTRYGATPWRLAGEIPEGAQDLVLGDAGRLHDGDAKIVFSALPGDVAGPLETRYKQHGLAVFTNAAAHREDADVPILVAEVNPGHLQVIEAGGGFIVANGNCSGAILSLALAPLVPFGINAVHVTTMQGLSGAGHPGVSALDVTDNVIPYIPGEEDKVEREPQKTHGQVVDGRIEPASFSIRATTTRVPVLEGHLQSVHVEVRERAAQAEVAAAFDSFNAQDTMGLPSSPARPVHRFAQPDRPQPRLDRDAGGGMQVSIGRLRVDGLIRFMALGNNAVRGAAGGSILNAELAHRRGLLARL